MHSHRSTFAVFSALITQGRYQWGLNVFRLFERLHQFHGSSVNLLSILHHHSLITRYGGALFSFKSTRVVSPTLRRLLFRLLSFTFSFSPSQRKFIDSGWELCTNFTKLRIKIRRRPAKCLHSASSFFSFRSNSSMRWNVKIPTCYTSKATLRWTSWNSW